MPLTELLTEIAAAGATLTRLPGDRIKADGNLSPAIHQQLEQYKTELLAILPDPSAELAKLWTRAVQEANALLSGVWFGTADEWRRLDEIEQRFVTARDAGDAAAARQAASDYRSLCEQFCLIEQALQAGREMDAVRPGYPRPMPSSLRDACTYGHANHWQSVHGPHWICEVCHPPATSAVVANRRRLCRSCWFDVENRDEIFCRACREQQRVSVEDME